MVESNREQQLRRRRVLRWQHGVEEQMDGLDELAQTEDSDGTPFFNIGDRKQVGHFLGNPDSYDNLTPDKKQEFLEGVEATLGTDMFHFTPSAVVRSYIEEGVPGAVSELGATAYELCTKFPRWHLLVLSYRDPKVGRQYDVLRVAEHIPFSH